MTTNTSTTDSTATETPEEVAPTFEKGSWQDNLNQSVVLRERAGKANKRAGVLLWDGAKSGIEGWLPNSSTDVAGEGFYNEVLTAMGKERKGDASKIKTVALAVKDHGLVLSAHANLSKAYAAAKDLTQGAQNRANEDDAAEKAIESIDVPRSTTTTEGAAAILLGKGIDGAVVAILDALGANNEAAHRAFMRAVSTEIAARVQAAKPKPVKKAAAAPKAGATKASGTKAAVKAKPAAAKAKGKPVGKAAKAAAPEAPVEEAPSTEPINAGVETSEPVATTKAKPVRKPVRRPARAV